MKVLIYGRESLVSKVTQILAHSGIETVEISNPADTPAGLKCSEKPDLALIDKNAEDAARTCKDIQKSWDIPVVLIVGRNKTDWEGLEGLMASGYVPDTFRNGELVAYLNAIHRRTTPFGKGVVTR